MFTLNPTGFTLDFANGYSVSVQWNSFHMCSNKTGLDVFPRSISAEVAVFGPGGEIVASPEGWKDADEVAEIIKDVSSRSLGGIAVCPTSPTGAHEQPLGYEGCIYCAEAILECPNPKDAEGNPV